MVLFEGFPPELPGFLGELAINNSQSWIADNKMRLEKICYQPCRGLIAGLNQDMKTFQPPHELAVEFEDVNPQLFGGIDEADGRSGFTHPFIHLFFETTARLENGPRLHLVFSSAGFGIGAGISRFNNKQLLNFKNAIELPERLDQLCEAVETAKTGSCYLEKLAVKNIETDNMPSGPASSFRNFTGLVVRNRNEEYPSELFGSACVDYLGRRLRRLLALQDWLVENVF